MSRRESQELALVRWEKLHLVQELYPTFSLLLHDVMELLGFETSDIQYDIGDYIVNGPLELMVQAQRGQAKTTIAAAAAVFALIHDPTERVVIVSAGGTQANEISTLIVRIILTMPELECLRPDHGRCRAGASRTSSRCVRVGGGRLHQPREMPGCKSWMCRQSKRW